VIDKKRKTNKKQDRGRAIYSWVFTSNREVEGMKAQYQTLLWEDGSLSCNCPGWIFPKKNAKTGEKIRSCKHTKQVLESSPSSKDIYKKWKSGESLPEIEDSLQIVHESIPITVHKTGSSIKYERKMDI
jgi:hypothetical protein